jgi:hypothetical protein
MAMVTLKADERAVSAAGSVLGGVNCGTGELREKAQAYIGAVQPYDAAEVGTDARPQKAETLNHCA